MPPTYGFGPGDDTAARVDGTRRRRDRRPMADDLTALADRIYEQALERTGARDPREF